MASLYAARAYLAHTPADVHAALNLATPLTTEGTSSRVLDARAVVALANYFAGSTEDALMELDELLAETGEQGLAPGAADAGGLEGPSAGSDDSDGRMVRVCAATAFLREGTDDRRAEALEVLREAVDLGHDQEALSALCDAYIALARAPRAQQLLASSAVRSFTSDSVLSQLIAARVALATGPSSKYMDAYHTFEEVRGMQGARGEGVLAGVCAAQATRSMWPEAESALSEALEIAPEHPTLLASELAIGLHAGRLSATASIEDKLAYVPPFVLSPRALVDPGGAPVVASNNLTLPTRSCLTCWRRTRPLMWQQPTLLLPRHRLAMRIATISCPARHSCESLSVPTNQ